MPANDQYPGIISSETPTTPGHVHGQGKERFVFIGRADQALQVNDTAADDDVALAEIGPGLMAKPIQ